jgi:hypothetical protein
MVRLIKEHFMMLLQIYRYIFNFVDKKVGVGCENQSFAEIVKWI